MKRLRLVVVAFVVALLMPSQAYASTMLGAYSAGYDADDVATEYLGFDTYMTLDQGLKTVIHNSSTSGGSGTTANPNYPYYAAFRNSLSAAFNYLPGSGNTWYSSYNGFGFADAVDRARADLAKAFRWWETNKEGIESGGGSSGGEIGSSIVVTLDGVFQREELNVSSTKTISVPSQYANGISNFIDGYYSLMTLTYHANSSKKWVFRVVRSESPLTYTTSLNSQNYILANVTSNSNITYRSYSISYSPNDNTASNFTLTSSGTNYGGNSTSYSSGTQWAIYSNVTGSGGGTYEPVEPDPLPPKNPSTPSDPVVPDPPETDNPVPSPDIDWGDTIITNINVTQTDPDYQPIINAISVVNQTLQQTQNLLLAFQNNMKAGFEGLDAQIYNNFQALLAQNDSWWNWLHDAWETGAQQLELWGDWLNSTIEEIRDDFDGFENNLVTWLQMIYNKIPSAGRSIPDPVTDDDDYFDWFKYIIDLILEKLGLLDSLTDFSNLFAQLRTVFPFSVPWDVAAILGLFAHDPVTPVFDFPYPTYVNGQWTSRGVACDLTPWNPVASVCRTFIKILFAYYLALWTREGLKNFEVSNDD